MVMLRTRTVPMRTGKASFLGLRYMDDLFAVLATGNQGTTKQNRTEQTKAQKQEKHTRTDKALSAEQAADFGMWQQSSAAPAC